MKKIKIDLALAILATGTLALAAGTNADAALISINTATLSGNGAEISGGAVTPNVRTSWNANENETGDPTVNGVSFLSAQPSDITVSFPGGGGQSEWNANDVHYDTAAFDQIMDSYLATALGGTATITVSGLVDGETYRVQMLHHQDLDAGGGNNRQFRVYFGSNTSGSNGGLFDVSGDQGYITTADFTASGTSQSFFFSPNDGGDRGILNGIVVYDTVPEPASLALLALGGLCMLRGRPRRGSIGRR